MRKFGCPVWAKIPPEIRPKSDLTAPKTDRGRFLGLVQEGPGYFVLNEATDKWFVSRNVAFREEDLDNTSALTNNHHPDDDPEEDGPSGDSAGETEVGTGAGTGSATGSSANGDGNGEEGNLGSQEVSNQANDEIEIDNEDPEYNRLRSMALIALAMFTEVATAHDPLTYAEAMASPQVAEWLETIVREFASLKAKGVFREVKVPKDAKTLGTKWVFKRKLNELGNVLKYKARLVAKGYSQIPGVHYTETFSPVARLTSLRILLAYAQQRRLEVRQLDVETAYLNTPLTITNYVEFPEGYVPENRDATGLAVVKALYGLTQSAREWWTKVNSFSVNELKFKMFNGDWGLYGRKIDSDNHVLILVYVDDILVVGRRMDVENTITKLKRNWVMTDAGSAKWILGIHVQRTESTLCLSQQAYIESISERYNVEGNRPISTPFEANLKLLPRKESDLMADQQKY